jgi:hypothetical protein
VERESSSHNAGTVVPPARLLLRTSSHTTARTATGNGALGGPRNAGTHVVSSGVGPACCVIITVRPQSRRNCGVMRAGFAMACHRAQAARRGMTKSKWLRRVFGCAVSL